MTSRRLSAPAGARLDRGKAIAFSFNGRSYSGFMGDTLASALLANDVRLVGRSFKLHRPRGIYSCGIEEPTALVDVCVGASRTPNVRATVLDIYPGLVAESQNCWPSVGFDLAAINSRFSALLPAGFYYKTFKWPNWHVFEPSIRAMAGLGRASRGPDVDRYEEVAADADVLVVGAGISGLSAAIAAATAGANVMLLESESYLDADLADLERRARDAGVRILLRTLAFGVYDHNLVCAREFVGQPEESASPSGALRQRTWKIRARSVIAATGAFERPMVFPDNDRPGVMLAGAGEKFAAKYGVAVGKRLLLAANSDSAYGVAGRLQQLGIEVAAIADYRPESRIGSDATVVSGILRLTQAQLFAVAGSRTVSGCTVATNEGSLPIDCDAILSAGGFAPAVHLHSQAGGKLRWVEESAMFVPDGPAPGVFSVGTCAGIFSLDSALNHASELGSAVARGVAAPPAPVGGAGHSLANTHVPRRGKKQFIDLQNDVTSDDVALAARENYRSVEHLKRYTTTGMGTDQGKTSNINALVLMGEETQRAPQAVGTTKFRPPFAPITMGAFAAGRVGALYRPLKHLPAERWHEERGAAFEEYGGWWRPAAYPLANETIEAAAVREAKAVRQGVGIFDGSALGKLELFGPDAAKFLDLMYVGTLSNLKVGQARYGLLLNENGVLVDDGIVARLAEQHFWINTTSGGVERTCDAFEEWLQCEYADFKVLVTPVTARWANVTVAGPKAWELLAAAGLDAALSPTRSKHMTLTSTQWDEVPLRVLRASFSGELGYEVNVPAEAAHSLFDRLWSLAPRCNVSTYGIEALQSMRIEKGYIHIGTDTDGTTQPGDVGFGRSIESKAANFVGRRSLTRTGTSGSERLQLVGLVAADRRTLLPVGAHLANSPPPTLTEGHVTSSTLSAELGYPISLGMLMRGADRKGERIGVHHLGTMIAAEVVALPFVDSKGTRVNG